jgi:hypothetical protein
MAAGDVKTYSGDQITVAFGPILPTGLGPDEFVTIEQNEDTFTDEQGIDGEVVRSNNLDYRATIVITLMQTSATNDLFSALHNTDRKSKNGAGIATIYIRDRQGRSLHTGAKAWISKTPQRAYARKAGTRVWTIRVAKLESFDGGN